MSRSEGVLAGGVWAMSIEIGQSPSEIERSGSTAPAPEAIATPFPASSSALRYCGGSKPNRPSQAGTAPSERPPLDPNSNNLWLFLIVVASS